MSLLYADVSHSRLSDDPVLFLGEILHPAEILEIRGLRPDHGLVFVRGERVTKTSRAYVYVSVSPEALTYASRSVSFPGGM